MTVVRTVSPLEKTEEEVKDEDILFDFTKAAKNFIPFLEKRNVEM